jgi:hypothetical protein
LGVLSLAVLPAEHLHMTHEHDGHHAEVVHRHFAPHHPLGEPSLADFDDHDVHWLSSWFTSPPRTDQQVSLQQLATQPPLFLLPQLTHERTVRIDDVSVHDPPPVTPCGLRAPPSLAL